jgi:hypothetical protein
MISYIITVRIATLVISCSKKKEWSNDFNARAALFTNYMRDNPEYKNHAYAHKQMAEGEGTWAIMISRQTDTVSAQDQGASAVAEKIVTGRKLKQARDILSRQFLQ